MELSKKDIEFRGTNIDDITKDDLQHGESDLFILDDEIYKVLDGSIAHKREEICSYIKECESEYFKINNLCFEDEKFYGYSMPYYTDYVSLKDLLNSDLSLDERKEICYKILKIYEDILFEHKLTFYDWHMNNILIGKDIKLLDIDSALLNASYNNECSARKYLLMLIIEFLNNIDDTVFVRFAHEEIDILEKLVADIDVSMCNTLPLAFEDIRKEIDSTTKTKIANNNVLTKKLLKINL